MTTPRDPDRLIHAFLLEGAEQLDDQVFDAVRAGIDEKRQRVVIGPWRVPTMSKLVPLGLGAAAVVAVLFLGSQFIGSPSSNVGGPASQPPASATPSEAPASAASAAPASTAPSPVSPPPLTGSFTSTQHGISMSYPEGWTTQPANKPWTGLTSPFSGDTVFDFMFDPIAHDGLFLSMASQPIGDATPEDWMATALASVECTEAEPTEVDGAPALIASEGAVEGEGCPVHMAVVTLGGRGYWIELYTSYDNPEFAPYDRAWFEEVLATVQLHPEDAVDAAP
jgi:hypothetical protein